MRRSPSGHEGITLSRLQVSIGVRVETNVDFEPTKEVHFDHESA